MEWFIQCLGEWIDENFGDTLNIQISSESDMFEDIVTIRIKKY